MYFLTSCGANWAELGVERPPTVREDLAEEERQAIIDSVTCEECRATLGRWGYIKA
jgi:hypothetical protein